MCLQIRAVVQLFTGRAELLEKGETTDQHVAHQAEESKRIEADKKNTDPKKGGIFKGLFSKLRAIHHEPIFDHDDNVYRCPHCSWELDEMRCVNCGYRANEDESDWMSDSGVDSDMNDDPYAGFDDELEIGFDGAPTGLDWAEWYDQAPLEAFPGSFNYIPPHYRNNRGTNQAPGTFYDPVRDSGSHDSAHEEDDDDEGEEDDMEDAEDEDMDSFIDDEGVPSEHSASSSDRSTVAMHREYTRAQLPDILAGMSRPQLSTGPSRMYGPHPVADSEDEEDYDEDEEIIDEDTLGEEDSDEDDDDEDEPVRPAIAGSRRIPTYQILSSSPSGVNGGTANISNARPRTQPPPAGSSANLAIALDDDSDEGPVAPTRRARSGGNVRPPSVR